jgi:hypothetical protein
MAASSLKHNTRCIGPHGHTNLDDDLVARCIAYWNVPFYKYMGRITVVLSFTRKVVRFSFVASVMMLED